MQTAFVAWFYNGLGGINPDPASPGFKHTILSPQFIADDRLTHVKTQHLSPHGQIISEWRVDKDGIHYHCEIPPNTTATVNLPNQPSQEIGSGAYDFAVERK